MAGFTAAQLQRESIDSIVLMSAPAQSDQSATYADNKILLFSVLCGDGIVRAISGYLLQTTGVFRPANRRVSGNSTAAGACCRAAVGSGRGY